MTTVPRSPVHVVYGGAHLFKADTARRLGEIALETLRRYAPTAASFARALGSGATQSKELYRRVTEKLRHEPVEDYRIDFEDGFGFRTDGEEDRYARSAAEETAAGMAARTLPPMIGIRLKPLAPAWRDRSVRTLEIYLGSLAAAADHRLPENFVVTLPKVTSAREVRECVGHLARLERELRLDSAIRLELMVETPEALMDRDGRCPLPSFLAAGEGRCTALHFGPYDYTAALGIAATEQRIDHPACDAARSIIQLACAGTGVRTSDGPVNLLPVPPHRSDKRLSQAKERENRAVVTRLWRHNFELVGRSLRHGYYQGWDLHPAQLPVRYAAVFAFFLEQVETQAARLRAFAARQARASVAAGVFDDAATVRGVINFFRRGIACGALTAADLAVAGIGPEDLREGPDA